MEIQIQDTPPTPQRRRVSARSIARIGVLLVLTALAYFGGSRAHRYYLASREYAPAPDGMVLVPAGEFWMGTNDEDADTDERPLRRVFLRSFYIDAHEVTNREYKQVVPTHTYASGHDDYPATHILKHEAEAYARAVGKRLPTNAEWEKAARGTDARRYPWGDDFVPGKSNIGLNEKLKPIGSFPEGTSPYGCADMAGNAWEWVSDTYRDFALSIGAGAGRGIIRGGAHGYGPYQARTSYLGFESLDTTCNDVGLRCVSDASPL